MPYSIRKIISFETFFLIYNNMNRIERYDDFILESEFARISAELRMLAESGTINVGDTIEWNLGKFAQDEPSPEMEWTFEPKKTKLGAARDRISGFADWLKRGDTESGLGIDHPIIGKIRDFIEKVKDPERIRQYFHRLAEEIKSLPHSVKKDLLKKLAIVAMAYIPLSDLITPQDELRSPELKQAKSEIAEESTAKEKPEARSSAGSKKATFDRAQHLVKTVEAGYSKDKKDTGNWLSVPGGKRFIGTNHGISAPVLAQYFKDKGIDRMITKQDMIDLSYETAVSIYKKDYWDAQGLSSFKSQSIANVLYDGCVNQGAGATLDVLKKSMEKMGHETEGIGSWKEFHQELTPKVNEMHRKETKELFETIKEERLERYKESDTWEDHGRGWADRLDGLAFEDGGEEATTDIA